MKLRRALYHFQCIAILFDYQYLYIVFTHAFFEIFTGSLNFHGHLCVPRVGFIFSRAERKISRVGFVFNRRNLEPCIAYS